MTASDPAAGGLSRRARTAVATPAQTAPAWRSSARAPETSSIGCAPAAGSSTAPRTCPAPALVCGRTSGDGSKRKAVPRHLKLNVPYTRVMASTDHQPTPELPRCNASKLAGTEASFAHWHFCELPPDHEGPHRCMSCQAEFAR
jgi:hypothetical protein